MSLRKQTPCDVYVDEEGFHHCPYAEDGDYVNCEYWCGAEEPQDDPYIWGDAEEDEEEEPTYEEEMQADLDMGFDPYMGCYTDDC